MPPFLGAGAAAPATPPPDGARREGDHLRVQSQGEPACSLVLRITGDNMAVADEGPCVSFHCGSQGDFTITKATRR